MTSPSSPKEPGESSGYSELFEEFHLRAEDLGRILTMGGERSASYRTLPAVGSSHLPFKQVSA